MQPRMAFVFKWKHQGGNRKSASGEFEFAKSGNWHFKSEAGKAMHWTICFFGHARCQHHKLDLISFLLQKDDNRKNTHAATATTRNFCKANSKEAVDFGSKEVCFDQIQTKKCHELETRRRIAPKTRPPEISAKQVQSIAQINSNSGPR